jgi:L-aminopeptidase/D-esterase-like protein
MNMASVSTVDLGLPGVRVGHHTDERARTGCTVVRFDAPARASGEVRGGAPATREFALLDSRRFVDGIDAVVLTGGSAFGLASCDGVVDGLAAAGVGLKTRHATVPIVVGMALYDLGVGDATARPDAAAGRAALDAAGTEVAIGPVGAGTGATVGTWRGPEHARPGGLGIARVAAGETVVVAVVAVNAVGDLATEPEGSDTIDAIADGSFEWPETEGFLAENTTIGVIITNAASDKIGCRRLAEAGHDGLARAIVPAHTPYDGDALVAASIGDADIEPVRLLTMAAAAVEHAIGSIRSP